MRKLIAIALACACAHSAEQVKPAPAPQAALAPVKQVESTPSATYKEAHDLMAQGQWDSAQAKLDSYLAREPKSAAALFDAGWVAERRNRPKEAQSDYEKALQIEPAHLGAALNLARLLQDQPESAERVLRAALQKSDDPKLLDALASVQRSEKKLDAAEETVRQVLVRHPRDADAYRNLAAIEADRGHVRLAESALNNARKLDDKDAGILNSLGLLAMRRDDPTAARGYFEEAVKLDPSFAPAWANLGALALSYRDYAAAEDDYGKAIAIEGGRWETRLARGWALEGLKRPKDARAEYEKVLALKPSQEDALYGRALALKAEGDLPDAMQAFKEYVASSKPARLKEAQNQIAQIDLRLKNPPAQLKPAAQQKAAAAELDLSKLPQGTDTGAPSEKLPADETMGPGAAPVDAAPKPADKPAAGKDGGVQNAIPAGAVKAASR